MSRFKLPKRIVTVLEGESLINDASSLVLYKFAVAAVGVGTVSYGQGALQFFAVAIGGALVGWAVGRAAMWIFTHLEDTLLDLTISILASFAAYLAAEAVHASGVLAAVTCGLVLGRQQHTEFTARTRIELVAVWGFMEFVLTSLVFILIGLQLRGIVGRLADDDVRQLVLLAFSMSATLIVGRFVWVFASAWLPRALSSNLRARDPMPPWSHSVVIAWTGMRGVVSLAAALALPEQFPSRDIILFLAFCSIFATLVLQGTTLEWMATSWIWKSSRSGEPSTTQDSSDRSNGADVRDKPGGFTWPLQHQGRKRLRWLRPLELDPDGGGCEAEDAKEGSGGLLVASSGSTPFLRARPEVFHVRVVVVNLGAVGNWYVRSLGWNGWPRTHISDPFAESIGQITAVTGTLARHIGLITPPSRARCFTS